MSNKAINYSESIGNKLSDFQEVCRIEKNGEKYNFTTLGKGCFGYTEKMESKKNGQIYAIKKLDKQKIENKALEKLHFKREVQIQQKLSHENLVKFYGFFEDKEKIDKYKEIYPENFEIKTETKDKDIYCLILEYCPNGTLKRYVENHLEMNRQSKAPIDQCFVIKVFREILNALIYLKRKKVLHRDIKPDNILFDKNYNVKISDFGVSALYKDKDDKNEKDYDNDEYESDEDDENNIDKDLYMNNSLIGPREFAAPEVLNRKKYDYSADIYSLGMTIFYMMNSDIPSYTKFLEKGKDKLPIRKKKFKAMNNYYSYDLRKLVKKMLSVNPKKRPSVEDVYDELLQIEFPLKNSGDTIFDFEEYDGKMRYKKNLMYYYIKKFDTTLAKDNSLLQKFIHKANTLFKDIKHNNLVKYYGLIEEKVPNNIANNISNETNYYLIYEYLDNGSLAKLLEKKIDSEILSIPEEFVIKIFKQVLSGLKYLHHENMAHGNIQPSKLYFDKNYNIKIGGFDLLGLYEDEICEKQIINDDVLFINDHYEYYGKYFSPEMIKGEIWNNKSDIYSLGLVIISLISKGDPISLSNEKNGKIKRYVDLNIINHNYNNQLIQLIKTMIKENPNERPTAKDIYKKLLEIEDNIKKSKKLNNLNDSIFNEKIKTILKVQNNINANLNNIVINNNFNSPMYNTNENYYNKNQANENNLYNINNFQVNGMNQFNIPNNNFNINNDIYNNNGFNNNMNQFNNNMNQFNNNQNNNMHQFNNNMNQFNNNMNQFNNNMYQNNNMNQFNNNMYQNNNISNNFGMNNNFNMNNNINNMNNNLGFNYNMNNNFNNMNNNFQFNNNMNINNNIGNNNMNNINNFQFNNNMNNNLQFNNNMNMNFMNNNYGYNNNMLFNNCFDANFINFNAQSPKMNNASNNKIQQNYDYNSGQIQIKRKDNKFISQDPDYLSAEFLIDPEIYKGILINAADDLKNMSQQNIIENNYLNGDYLENI